MVQRAVSPETASLNSLCERLFRELSVSQKRIRCLCSKCGTCATEIRRPCSKDGACAAEILCLIRRMCSRNTIYAQQIQLLCSKYGACAVEIRCLCSRNNAYAAQCMLEQCLCSRNNARQEFWGPKCSKTMRKSPFATPGEWI